MKRERPRKVTVEMVKAVHAAGLERIELERLRDRVGHLFAALQEATQADVPPVPGSWLPPVDLCEMEDSIVVQVELPGVRAGDIKVGLTSTQLTVGGQKKKGAPRQRVLSHLCSERSYGPFSRTIPLRWTVSVREATAELRNGILMVRLPKLRDRRGAEFKVPIKDAGD
ncbi:MAG TPA: Hsp20/alpha crystallin family protein [Pyrinomonadaceae bacterium]|nr:Hsp20/alpha crystallin family protein [Pyrinomonadaceae bacterium]